MAFYNFRQICYEIPLLRTLRLKNMNQDLLFDPAEFRQCLERMHERLEGLGGYL